MYNYEFIIIYTRSVCMSLLFKLVFYKYKSGITLFVWFFFFYYYISEILAKSRRLRIVIEKFHFAPGVSSKLCTYTYNTNENQS